MTIKFIEISNIKIPLKYTFSTALRSTNQVDDYVITIKDLEGNFGFGSTTAVTAVTSINESTLKNELNYIKSILINYEINRIEDIKNFIEINAKNISNNTLSAIVTALFDYLAHKTQLPLVELLAPNNQYSNTIKTSITISLTTEQEMLHQALFWQQQGFDIIKLKLGTNPKNDLQIVKTISDNLQNSNINLILDFNQAYNVSQTVEFINALSKIENLVSMIEQPTLKKDLPGLKTIKSNSNLPIIADEACFTLVDLKKLIDLNAADGINIKLIKCGGLLNALQMQQIATAADLKIMVGCMLECPIGITAAAHFAAAIGNAAFTDLDPLALIAHNPIRGGASINNNIITLNQSPGLGIIE